MGNDKTIVTSIKNLSPLFTELLTDGISVKFIVTGNSMYPLFRSKVDTVVLRKKLPLNKYDIVLYQRESGDYVLHRIVNIKNNKFHMAGDYETEIEYPIYENQVIAAVEGFFRKNKYVSCRNPIYMLYSIIWNLVIPKRHKIIDIYNRIRCIIRRRRW